MNRRFTARPARNRPRRLRDCFWATPWVFNESLAYALRDCFSMQNLTQFGVDEDRMGQVATPTTTKKAAGRFCELRRSPEGGACEFSLVAENRRPGSITLPARLAGPTPSCQEGVFGKIGG